MRITTFALALFSAVTAFAGDPAPSKKVVTPLEEEPWKFLLAVPGWMPGVNGTAGINGFNSNVDVPFRKILPKVDMIWATSAEVSKGRFGAMGELIYMSLSDGVGSSGPIQKVDVRLDQYLADFTLRYRVLEGPRGFVDLLAGVRYTNIFQHVRVAGNDSAISQTAKDIVDGISEELRGRVEERISDGRFRTALKAALGQRISNEVEAITGPNGRSTRTLPVAPLLARDHAQLGSVIQELIHRKERELVASTAATVREAVATEEAALRATLAADRAALRARAVELRTRVDQRIAAAQADLQKSIARRLDKALNQQVNRDDAWWDPYVGLRARYNFTPAIYVIGRGDIGGFGIGSDLMWQAEGALGVQLTRSIYGELGYRALSFDYNKHGFLYDTITHGPQLTVGVLF